ncbi:MAG: hypothetical protein ACLRRU_03165 [Faecalibacterium sp.]
MREAISVTGMGSGGRYLVSQLKAMRTEIFNTSLSAEGRAVLLYHVERMNEESANALLKVMEEPPEGVLFPLTADSLAGGCPPSAAAASPKPCPRSAPKNAPGGASGRAWTKCRPGFYSELSSTVTSAAVLAAARDDARREQVEKALTLAKAAAAHDSYAAAVLLAGT